MSASDAAAMDRAIALAASVRRSAPPNPWVGAVLVAADGTWHEGATAPPGGPHAEASALAAAGPAAAGATVCVTRVVTALCDPDPRVSGRGLAALRAAGVTVEVGLRAAEVTAQLQPYLTHRTTGRPWVVLKLAATLDGRTAAPDGTSRWITGEAARRDVHRLRAESDAVMVGSGTVRADDPALTVRDHPGPDPQRVVLGQAPHGARVQPAWELSGEPGEVLDELGRRGVLQVLVEGGAATAHQFHAAGLVDRYVLYLAPALLGGDDGRPLLAGPGAATIAGAWRGRIVGVARLGDDLRVELEPAR